tara:strand:- start:17 stop:691 length:675 start_codon:yes stop_codon:yes gene_type:complete
MEVINEIMVKGIVVGVFAENCWIVGNRRTGEAICIDPGDQPDEVLALAKEMGVKIKIIANSHAHVDHILGVRGVQRASNAQFLLHEADLQLLQTGWMDTVQRLNLDIPEGPPDPNYYVKSDDIVEVDGLRLKAIATPGHTPGSMSYYTEGLLFSGDTLFKGSIGRTDLPGGNYEEEMRSIETLLTKLPDETVVLPGHMSETTIAAEKANNPFFQDWKTKQQSQN